MLAVPDMVDREDALASLRAFIVAGRHNPGNRLTPERELMVSLGMTRTRLRRAAEALQREGAMVEAACDGCADRAAPRMWPAPLTCRRPAFSS